MADDWVFGHGGHCPFWASGGSMPNCMYVYVFVKD